jgi:hypothetical protein
MDAGRVMSAQVIDRFVAHSYERQAEKEKKLGFMTLTTTERRYFHEGLAVFMAIKGTTNQITGTDMEAVVERLYKSYPDNSHIVPDIIMERDYAPLKRRLADPDSAIETIATDVRTHGILVDDPARPGAFRFAHKSFYELLYAKSFACDLLDVEPTIYKAIRTAMDGSMGQISQTGQIIRFFAEVLVDKFPDKSTGEFSYDVLNMLIGLPCKQRKTEEGEPSAFWGRLERRKFRKLVPRAPKLS